MSLRNQANRHCRVVLVHFGLGQYGVYHERDDFQALMEKSIFTNEYAALLDVLREAREAKGLTQVQLAERLGQSQSFVSKAEIGERRLDIIQLRTICGVLGISLPAFVNTLEERLANRRKRNK